MLFSSYYAWKCCADDEHWAPLDGAIDKSILLQREPILFYAEVPLYESELDDNGSSQLIAKVSDCCVCELCETFCRSVLCYDVLHAQSQCEAAKSSKRTFAAQIRVMPSCWYILQRFFLRIDGHIVRIRDVRILFDFTDGKASLRREISHMEGSYDELFAGTTHSQVS